MLLELAVEDIVDNTYFEVANNLADTVELQVVELEQEFVPVEIVDYLSDLLHLLYYFVVECFDKSILLHDFCFIVKFCE